MNIAVKKIYNKTGYSESTLLWAIVCSILLHILLVVIIPNVKFDTVKKPEIFEVELVNKQEPPPVVIPETAPIKSEPIKPEPIEPKVQPNPIVKPAPPIVHKEEPTPIQSSPPPVQTAPTEVIAVAPKVEASPQVVTPAPPAKPTVTPTEINLAHDGYGNTLWSAISKFKKYPRIAQSRGWQGEVVVELSLDGNGKLISKKIIKNSGYEVLDQQALEMVDKAVPFPEPPEALRGSGFTIRVPIPFKLEQQ
ncbi:MAG: energy transducer TonB [Methylotenera sp.]|nr:energy transducer TonB [Methylotenera sp.]